MRSAARTCSRNLATIGSSAAAHEPTQSASVEVSISTPSRAKAVLWRFSGWWSRNLAAKTIARRLGPAKPRGMGCEGAGGSLIASQSRHANFSRTCSTIFQRRGSHSSVLETTSPSLRRRKPPHLPQARRAGALLIHRRGRRDLGFGLFLCLRLFEVLDRQFELLDEKLAAL